MHHPLRDQGSSGHSPFDWAELCEKIVVPVSLLDLFQVSPDAVRAFCVLSTRPRAAAKGKGKSKSRPIAVPTSLRTAAPQRFDCPALGIPSVRTEDGDFLDGRPTYGLD